MLAVRYYQHGGLGGFFEEKPELISSTLSELAGFVASGRLKLHMGGAFPLFKAAEAHRLLEGRRTMGKLVILPWEGV